MSWPTPISVRVASASLALVSILAIGTTSKNPQPALAAAHSQTNANQQSSLLIARNRLRFRWGARSSRYRYSGFSRSGRCLNEPVTVLAPPTRPEEITETGDAGVDLTVSAHPMVFAYVPQTTANTRAEFTLQNEAGTEQLYEAAFNLTGQAGIVGIQIPNSVTALQPGQNYVWYLAVQCSADRSEDVVIDSWITRTALTTPLSNDPQIRAFELANAGIWQDAVSALALLRYSNNSNASVESDWSDLITSAGLPSNFATAPIVQIVQ